jgi:integrase
VDFAGRKLKFGKDKTAAGDYRTIPIGRRVADSLSMWALHFPSRKPEHYVFPSEKYGTSGHKFGKDGGKTKTTAYDINPLEPMGSIKTAWINAQKRSGVKCRIHDLRHTAVSRMQDEGVPLMQIAEIVGWSASQTVLMAKRHGHFSTHQLRDAVEAIDRGNSHQNPTSFSESHQNSHQSGSITSQLLTN